MVLSPISDVVLGERAAVLERLVAKLEDRAIRRDVGHVLYPQLDVAEDFTSTHLDVRGARFECRGE